MTDSIKSKISGDTIFWGVLMVIPLFGFTVFTYRILNKFKFEVADVLILMFFAVLFSMLINFFKHVRFLIVEENKLKYYSLLKPFGKTLDINKYIGKIILDETGTRGSYKVIYLVDKKNITSFKIMGLHYKNFDAINDALQLKVLKFNPSIFQYFKLLFFERIDVKSSNENKNGSVDLILAILRFIGIIGIVLFLFSLIIKLISDISD